MTETIPDLWPPIDNTVVDPVAILRVQASKLAEHTNGLLEGEVTPFEREGDVELTFDIVAPALNRYRYTLLEASHGSVDLYPVEVKFEWDQVNPADGFRTARKKAVPASFKLAATKSDFIRLVGDALKSVHAQSVISSLIARSKATSPPTA